MSERSRQRVNQIRNRLAKEPSVLGIAQAQLAAVCKHTGRVRPVIWKAAAESSDGDLIISEDPQTVVCEQCWRAIGASEPAYSAYEESEDGWYSPVGVS